MNNDDLTLLEQLATLGTITIHKAGEGWIIGCTWLRTTSAARHRTDPAVQFGDAIRDALSAAHRDINQRKH